MKEVQESPKKIKGAEVPTVQHVHFHLTPILDVRHLSPLLHGVLKLGASPPISSGEQLLGRRGRDRRLLGTRGAAALLG